MFKKSKWVPLTTYSNEMMSIYLLMGSVVEKTGIIKFKSIRMNSVSSHNVFSLPLDIKEQFKKLLELGDLK